MSNNGEPAPLAADAAIKAVAALDDDLRRGMFEFIRAARRPVTREEAAEAVGISRKLAAFHLDKLVSAGLLRSHSEPVGGLRKVGRTPKVYEPTQADIRISIPERQHEVLAAILIDAILTHREDETARQSAMRSAHEHGEAVAATERLRLNPGRLGPERALTLSEGLLNRHGYQPDRVSPVCVALRSCPFHPLADQAPELVCGLNHAFLTGMLVGLQAPAVDAVLQPQAGECCVQLRAAKTA